MLDWLRKRKGGALGGAPGGAPGGARELLFGDVPLERWAGREAASGEEPWASFADAAARLGARDAAGARAALEGVLARRGLESRHYLEAWHALRALGVAPPPIEQKHLYGVVVDVPVTSGVDTLAAYEDRSARYLNFSGAAVVWERPDASLDPLVDALLAAGRDLVARIGTWEGERPPLPPRLARVSLLTPSGLHFGQGAFDALAADPMAAPVIGAAGALMRALVGRATEKT